MAGTTTGGKTAAAKNKAKFGDDFFAKIGAIGGRLGHTGGFASMTPERRSECGRKGGAMSSRMNKVKYMVRYNDRLMTIQQCADELQLSKAWVAELARQKDNKYGLTLLQHERNIQV